MAKFEKLTTGINNFANKESITAEEMLGLFDDIRADVCECNNVEYSSEIPCDDVSELGRYMLRLFNNVLSVYDANKEKFPPEENKRLKRLEETKEKILSAEQEIVKLDAINKELEIKKQEAETKNNELEKTRGHLRNIKDECKILEENILLLSDSKLDELAEEKEKLSSEFERRKLLSNEIQNDIKNIQSDLNAEVQQNNQLESDFEKTSNELERIKKENEEITCKKNESEILINKLKNDIIEAQKWIEDFDNQRERVQSEKSAIENKLISLSNALESIRNDQYIKETLFVIPNISEELTVENCPDINVTQTQFSNFNELSEWFNTIENRINGLMNYYNNLYKIILENAEMLTSKESDGK